MNDSTCASTTSDTSVGALVDRLYSNNFATGKTGKTFDSVSVSTRNNLKTIERLMQSEPPPYTLEVGMCFGGSTVVFAAMHQRLNPNPAPRHIVIDPNESTIWDHVGSLKIEEAGLSEFVRLIEEPSSIALPTLVNEGRKFGLIYIDGSHLFEDVFVDAYFCARLLEQGGYLLFDDSTNKHIAKVLAFINATLPALQRQPDTTLRQKIARCAGKRQLTIYRRIGEIERDWKAAFQRF